MDVKDILTTNGDIIFSQGDIKIGFSDDQHQQHLIELNKGQVYQFPLVGVGINSFRNGNFTAVEIKKAIRTELVNDGYTVDSLKVSNQDELIIDVQATRKK